MRIGVISDTHGLLRPEALAALQGSEHILHAGDVGEFSILDTLRQIAPVTAIRGNVDHHGPCGELPATQAVSLGGHLFYMLHNIDDLDLHPDVAQISAVIYGHSHQPAIRQHQGVMYLNPGSAGPVRFRLPVTLATVQITPDGLSAEIIPLLLA